VAERVVLVGYGPVGARFVEELLPAVRAGLVLLTVVGAELAEAYNRVLVAEYAVGEAERESLEVTDADEAREAGVRILTGTTVVQLQRSRRTVLLGSGEQLPYDRLVLATGARAQLPTLDGVMRRAVALRPPTDGHALDHAETPLPPGVTMLRDLDDAERLGAAVRAGSRIVVLGAGVLGMELALAAARAGAEVCVVFHGAGPMERNLDGGASTVLARAARRSGVSLIAHARAESVLLHTDEDGAARFDALLCADGKQVSGDLLVISCGVVPRIELASIAGLPVARGILVDEQLRSWGDPDIYAIGDCAHLAERPADGASSSLPSGGPVGLIGAGWRQAEWLARRFHDEVAAVVALGDPLPEERDGVIQLKSQAVDVVAAGEVHVEPWDDDSDGHDSTCATTQRSVAQWVDPAHGRYVKMVTRAGILEGFISVGMPRTAAELTLLFQRGSELPADRSVLLRYDGPDYEQADAGGSFAPSATVCWCNGVKVERIIEAAQIGEATVANVSRQTRAGTGCGGCKTRIGEILEMLETLPPHQGSGSNGTVSPVAPLPG
jgi:assimilatory nitrate reductase electron transfer subunit